MKIAYIANSRFPSEKAQSDQVMAMCAAFASAGHEVRLFVPNRRPVVAEDPFVHYGRTPTFGFERVPCIDALRWSMLGHVGLWIQTISFVYGLRRRLAMFHPDVVYSRELYVFSVGVLPGMRVWESHSLHRSAWARSLMRMLDGIVTLTKASKDRLQEQGISEEKLLVDGDAVDPALFDHAPSREEARVRLGIAPGAFLCLYTGKYRTMGMGKGLEESVAAMRILRAEGRDIQVYAVGGTADDLKVAQGLRGEGVTLEGHRPQQELKQYYAAADLLLMPFPYTEHYAYYMSPLKLFEYLISGIPMVVTDLPSVREVVDERAAFVAKPGDIPSLAACMRQAMDHSEDAQKRAQVAKTLSSRYTWDARARRIADWMMTRRSD